MDISSHGTIGTIALPSCAFLFVIVELAIDSATVTTDLVLVCTHDLIQQSFYRRVMFSINSSCPSELSDLFLFEVRS
jgi:hypothetical protein